MLKFEQGEREENDSNILKKANEEFIRLQNLVGSEKKSREDTEEAILEMLRIMITKMKNDIEGEKKERYWFTNNLERQLRKLYYLY
jgi:hypothetical protein